MKGGLVGSDHIDLELFPEAEEIFGWIEDLSKLPHRRTGTPEGERSAQYIAEKFRSFGLEDVRIEKYPALYFEPVKYSLKINGDDFPCFFINGTLRKAESGTFAATRKGKAKKCIFLKNPLITFIVFYFKEKCKIIH